MTQERLRRAFAAAWEKTRRQNKVRGKLGILNSDGTYTVKAAERPGFAHVRLGPEGDQGITVALNLGVPYKKNLPVEMIRAGEFGPLVITGVDTAGGILEYFSGGNTGSFGVGPHTHKIGSGLEYEIEAMRFEPGRVWFYSVFEVFINPFRYQLGDGTWETWPGGILDLASNQPSGTGNWAWVLVGVDVSDNSAVAVTGTEYSVLTPLTIDMLDDINFADYIPLAGIKFKESDSALNLQSRYFDGRGWFTGAGPGTGFDVNIIMTDGDGAVMVDGDGNVMVET